MDDRVTGEDSRNLLDDPPPDRVLIRGPLDEVVVLDAELVHLERMDVGSIWIRIDRKGGLPALVINLTTKRPWQTKINGMVEVEP